MTAEIIRFIPRDRRGDPDFPGIPELAGYRSHVVTEAVLPGLTKTTQHSGFIAPMKTASVTTEDE
jgi:hypothetical protein